MSPTWTAFMFGIIVYLSGERIPLADPAVCERYESTCRKLAVLPLPDRPINAMDWSCKMNKLTNVFYLDNSIKTKQFCVPCVL
jgi:hypothetical protein